jgi:hypothetical protein
LYAFDCRIDDYKKLDIVRFFWDKPPALPGLAFHFYIYSFRQKTDRTPHRFPHYRTPIAIRSRFLPREQLFPKNLVLLAPLHDACSFRRRRASAGISGSLASSVNN